MPEIDETEETTEVEETEESEDTTDESPEDDKDPFDADRALKKISKLNSENKNLREAKKAAEEKAAGVDEKDGRIKALEAENRRVRVGASVGLPADLIDRLKGDTEEEILEDAEKLLNLVAGKKPSTGRPKERLRGGSEPAEEPEETDPRKLAALVSRD